MLSVRALLLALALSGFAASAAAQVSKQDARAIRALINEQLDAFRRGDGERAFSLATAGIRATFGSAEVFMAMVRSDYPVVYRPASVRFEAPEIIEGTVVQPVRMTDAAGRGWRAGRPRRASGVPPLRVLQRDAASRARRRSHRSACR
jgi:type II secretory pathway pseudopilin PulG